MPSRFELISVRISSFCELARWVLDRAGIPYKESYHAPLWRRAAHAAIIKTPDAILDARSLIETLFPSDPDQRREVDSLVQAFFEDLAGPILVYAYANMLANPNVTTTLITDRAPWWEAVFVQMFYPAQAWAIRKALGITPASTEKARQQILSTFETVSARLEIGQLYFVGDRLTAADLTFAALTAPLLLPPEYGAPLPKFVDLPLEMEVTARAAQDSLAGQLALRIYRDHRNPAPPPENA